MMGRLQTEESGALDGIAIAVTQSLTPAIVWANPAARFAEGGAAQDAGVEANTQSGQ